MFNNKEERVENYDIDLYGVAYFLSDKAKMDMYPNIAVYQKQSDLKQFLRSLTLRQEGNIKIFTFKVIISRFVLVNGNIHEIEKSYIQFDVPYFGQYRYSLRLNKEDALVSKDYKQYNCFKNFNSEISKTLNQIKSKYNINTCKKQIIEIKEDPFIFLQKEGGKSRNSIIYFSKSIVDFFRKSNNYKVIGNLRESSVISVVGRFPKDNIPVFATLILIQPDKYLVTGITCDKICFTSIVDKPKNIYDFS